MGTDQPYATDLLAVVCTFIYSASRVGTTPANRAALADGESGAPAGRWRLPDETVAPSLSDTCSVINSTGFYC